MKKIIIRAGIGLIVIIMGSQLVVAEQGERAPSRPDLAKGRQIFIKHCAGCHGPEGNGDGYLLLGPDPANLTRSATKKKSDAILLQTIHEGKPNMPSWKGRLSEEESRAVLAYIRALKK